MRHVHTLRRSKTLVYWTVYRILRTDHGTLRKICGLESFKKIIYQGVQENIVILNVTTFCFQTKVFGNIKFYCLIITPFVS